MVLYVVYVYTRYVAYTHTLRVEVSDFWVLGRASARVLDFQTNNSPPFRDSLNMHYGDCRS